MESKDQSEWVRMPVEGARVEGISRAVLYLLIKSGKIRGKVVRMTPGSKRGMTYVNRNDIRAVISSSPDAREVFEKQAA